MPEDAARPRAGFQAPAFATRPPWLTGDLQTIRNTVLNRLGVGADLSPWPGQRLDLPMQDGTGDALMAVLHTPSRRADRPLAILIHGLTGCEDSAYVRNSARSLLRAGYPVLRLNLRGAGPSRLSCRREYHAGRSDDLRGALARLPADAMTGGVVAIGYSLGANMLLKYLGEAGAGTPLRAAVAVSAPIDLKSAQQRIMTPRNRVYHRYLLNRMKVECAEGREGVSAEERAAARAAQSVYAFDDVFVARRNGFGTADRYYAECSAGQFLPAIRVPTLVIHAHDDPWIPVDAYLRQDWPANPMLKPLLPEGGGHVGFHGRGDRRAWHDRCALAFFETVAG